MLVSFIIPHKGREELLERTIQSILDLEYDLQKIEIIVVSQNETLKCTSINHSIGRFRVIFRPAHETISTLRNIGAKHATGEYFVFMDADIQLSRNWLTVVFEELRAAPQRVLVSAVQQCAPDAGALEKTRVILNRASADRPVEFLGGGNLFLHRKTFMAANGFPEDVITCEDYYFTDTIHQQGEIYCTSKAWFIHLGEDRTYPEMFRKEIWRGQSNLHSFRGRRIALRELPSLLTPLWQAGFLLATGVFVAVGKPGSGIVCLGMVALPSILYAGRLYNLGKKESRFLDALCFYGVYHAARVIGTITGFFKEIKH